MLKKCLLIMYFIPLFIFSQRSKDENCSDNKRGLSQLPCKITSLYGTDIIPDKDAVIKYTDILINKRHLLDPEKSKPYKITLIAKEKVWHVVINNYNCRYCKLYININKNTGEVLNFYKADD